MCVHSPDSISGFVRSVRWPNIWTWRPVSWSLPPATPLTMRSCWKPRATRAASGSQPWSPLRRDRKMIWRYNGYDDGYDQYINLSIISIWSPYDLHMISIWSPYDLHMISISPISTWVIICNYTPFFIIFRCTIVLPAISGCPGPIAADVGSPRRGRNTPRRAASSAAVHGADGGGEDVESGVFAAAARGRST